jgi:DNA-binding HxlR family transcriptional regulator
MGENPAQAMNEALDPSKECPIIYAMNLLSSKWMMPIIWHLLVDGDLSYNDLRRILKDISNTMLTRCLKSLTESGLVDRTDLGGISRVSCTQYPKKAEGCSLPCSAFSNGVTNSWSQTRDDGSSCYRVDDRTPALHAVCGMGLRWVTLDAVVNQIGLHLIPHPAHPGSGV